MWKVSLTECQRKQSLESSHSPAEVAPIILFFKCLNQVIVGRREFGDMDNSSDEEQHGQSKGNTTFVEPAGVTTFEFSSAAQDSLEY